MRAMLVLAAVAAIGVALVAGGVVRLDEPSGSLEDPRASAPAPASAPAVAEIDRACGGLGLDECIARDRAVDDLTARLRADRVAGVVAVARAGGGRVAERRDVAAALRMLRSICPRDNTRGDCHRAVSSEAMRRVWHGLRAARDARHKARVLMTLGTRLRMTAVEVRNAVRAELDEQLTRSVAAGEVSAGARRRVMGCFDEPAACGL